MCGAAISRLATWVLRRRPIRPPWMHCHLSTSTGSVAPGSRACPMCTPMASWCCTRGGWSTSAILVNSNPILHTVASPSPNPMLQHWPPCWCMRGSWTKPVPCRTICRRWQARPTPTPHCARSWTCRSASPIPRPILTPRRKSGTMRVRADCAASRPVMTAHARSGISCWACVVKARMDRPSPTRPSTPRSCAG